MDRSVYRFGEAMFEPSGRIWSHRVAVERDWRTKARNTAILVLAITTAAVVLVTLIFITLIQAPASMVALLGIVVISSILDFGWKRAHAEKEDAQLAH